MVPESAQVKELDEIVVERVDQSEVALGSAD